MTLSRKRLSEGWALPTVSLLMNTAIAMRSMMGTDSESVCRLQSKLRDLKISHKFLHEQLRGEGDILNYYKQEIKSAEKQIEVALSLQD